MIGRKKREGKKERKGKDAGRKEKLDRERRGRWTVKGERNDGRGSARTVRGQECNGRTMTRSGRGKGMEHVKVRVCSLVKRLVILREINKSILIIIINPHNLIHLLICTYYICIDTADPNN